MAPSSVSLLSFWEMEGYADCNLSFTCRSWVVTPEDSFCNCLQLSLDKTWSYRQDAFWQSLSGNPATLCTHSQFSGLSNRPVCSQPVFPPLYPWLSSRSFCALLLPTSWSSHWPASSTAHALVSCCLGKPPSSITLGELCFPLLSSSRPFHKPPFWFFNSLPHCSFSNILFLMTCDAKLPSRIRLYPCTAFL